MLVEQAVHAAKDKDAFLQEGRNIPVKQLAHSLRDQLQGQGIAGIALNQRDPICIGTGQPATLEKRPPCRNVYGCQFEGSERARLSTPGSLRRAAFHGW